MVTVVAEDYAPGRRFGCRINWHFFVTDWNIVRLRLLGEAPDSPAIPGAPRCPGGPTQILRGARSRTCCLPWSV